MKYTFLTIVAVLILLNLKAQQLDSIQKITLDEVVVSAWRQSTIEKKSHNRFI
ncbi:MAG: hypothetical protein ACYC2P_04860 [Paludibacteraceae bacterium]